jgi:dihydrofolate reductase
MPFDDAFNTHNLGLLEEADTMVYGGTWFANNLAHWAAVASDPTQSDRDRRIAERVLAVDNVVVSDSFRVDPDAAWAGHTQVVPRADAAAHIQMLKDGSGGHLLMFGSATTWNPLLERGLVDELIVLVGPGLTGGGSRIYAGNHVDLSLIDAQVLRDSQLVALRYAASGAIR